MSNEHGPGPRQACRCAGLARSSAQYKPHPSDDTTLIEALGQLVEKHPAIGERFNGNMRRELLDANVFFTLEQVRARVAEWELDFNYFRPHKALGYRSPMQLQP